MNQIPFTKMQSFSNDFVVLNGVCESIELSASTVRALAERRRGIGFDQLLIIKAATNNSADFRMRVFNADGSESAQCGNGARCVAHFIRQRKLADKNHIALEVGARIMHAHILADGQVSIDLGEPCFQNARVPFVAARQRTEHELTLEHPPTHVRITTLSMGNPHAVLQVADCAHADVQNIGTAIAGHKNFPESVNVGFMEIVARDHIRLRVRERGVGETPSCGSGAAAAVAAGRHLGLLDENVRVDMPGGEMSLSWAGRGHPVQLCGPVFAVYDGVITR